MKACLILDENDVCIGYLNIELIAGIFVSLVIFWGLISMFRIILNQLK